VVEEYSHIHIGVAVRGGAGGRRCNSVTYLFK